MHIDISLKEKIKEDNRNGAALIYILCVCLMDLY